MSARSPVLDPARLLRGRTSVLVEGPNWDRRAMVCLLRPSDGWTAVHPPGQAPAGAAEVVLVLADPALLDARGQPTPLDPEGRRIDLEGAADLTAMADHLAPAPYPLRMAGLAWWLHRFEALRRLAKERGTRTTPGLRRCNP